jgi:hypothetical protein
MNIESASGGSNVEGGILSFKKILEKSSIPRNLSAPVGSNCL